MRISLLLWLGCVACFSLVLVLPVQASSHAHSAGHEPCAAAARTPYPHTEISNGDVHAVVYLPDPVSGAYRSSRFDWSGIIACLSYKGHTFFGPWSDNTDPMGNDSVTGPVEEFRGIQHEIGYDQARPGEGFLKIGVGLLQRVDEKPYSFGVVYPLLNHGQWTVKVRRNSITFRQTLTTSQGYAYHYEKQLRLARSGPALTLSHSLRNLGSKPLDTDVYDHDFFVLDGQTVGPGFAVTFGFKPIASPPCPEPLVSWHGDKLSFTDTPHQGYAAQGYLTGFTGQPGEYRFEVQDRNHGIGVLQTSSSPLTQMYFWSTSRTICPEAYLGIHVPPGSTQHWRIQYTFEAP